MGARLARTPGMSTLELTPRSRFHGVTHVLKYNWPFYAAALVLVAAAIGASRLGAVPPCYSGIIWLGVGLTIFWSLSSALVTFFVYDLSPLYKWQWLVPLLKNPPQAWVSFHAGLDETSEALQTLFPGSKSQVFDFYDSRKMTEPSIERARRESRSDSRDMPVDFSALPLPDSEYDTAFLVFSAHEIRNHEDRLRFFKEIRRILKPKGRLVLVEHLRDLWNFTAYGPGFRHFFSRNEWLRVASGAGLSIEAEQAITPFVRCLVFERAETK